MLNLIIFGSPGAGKGTQAALLAKKYQLTHLSSGEILREELESGELGPKIKKYQDSGKLVPDHLITKIIEKSVIKNIKVPGFIFDGYPRTLQQARSLDKFCRINKIAISLVIDIKLSEKEAISRILQRAKTSGRSDDNLKTIKNRFRVYRRETKPAIDYYQKQHKLINIDGRSEIKIIFQSIKGQIDTVK